MASAFAAAMRSARRTISACRVRQRQAPVHAGRFIEQEQRLQQDLGARLHGVPRRTLIRRVAQPTGADDEDHTGWHVSGQNAAVVPGPAWQWQRWMPAAFDGAHNRVADAWI